MGGKKEKEGSGETKEGWEGKRQNRGGKERRAKFTRDVVLRKTLSRF